MSISLPVLYHSPTLWIGENLAPLEKAIYEDIKNEINKLFDKNVPLNNVMFNVVRKLNHTDHLGMDESIPLCKAVFKYLRHCLIDTLSSTGYYKVVHLLDALVRKSGIRVHVLVGRRRFLQTLSLTARQWKRHANDPVAQESADFAFDCIQAWHEAFYDLRAIFPEYQVVYYKLVWKYKVKFPRPEDDPSRLPIFMEQADDNSLLIKGPDEFLLSENIDVNPDVNYSIYDIENEASNFNDELGAVQRELRARDAASAAANSPTEGDDVRERQMSTPSVDTANANFLPATSSPSSTSRKVPKREVIAQRSFNIRRNIAKSSSVTFSGNMGAAASATAAKAAPSPATTPKSAMKESKKSFMIVSHSEGNEPHDTVRFAGEEKEKDSSGLEGDYHHHGNENTNEDEMEDQSVTIENRAFVVDGRIGIDTRAVVTPTKRNSTGNKLASWSPTNDTHHTIDADGKVVYDHYKSEKKLKSVPSHLFNQKSIKNFTNVEDRIERFNSHESGDNSVRSLSTTNSARKLASKGSGVDEEDANVEIRFFGNQRVVIAKKDAVQQ
jgi:hypothetical protein